MTASFCKAGEWGIPPGGFDPPTSWLWVTRSAAELRGLWHNGAAFYVQLDIGVPEPLLISDNCLIAPLRFYGNDYYRFFGWYCDWHSRGFKLDTIGTVIWPLSHGYMFIANCLKPMHRNGYIKMRKNGQFLDDPPPDRPHYKGLIIGWLINGIGIGNSWRGWTGTVFGVGFGQRLKLVVFPLNALMWNDNLDSTSTQEKSGFKGILYFYDIFYF